MRCADFVDDKMDFIEVGVFATGAIGGVGKHGDSRGVACEIFESGGGIFDNGVELLFGRGFVDAAVGKSEHLIVFFANKATGEKRGF